jgi:hypothetical protein
VRQAAPEISLISFELSMLPQLVRMIVQPETLLRLPHLTYRRRNVPWAEGRWETLTNSFRKILYVPSNARIHLSVALLPRRLFTVFLGSSDAYAPSSTVTEQNCSL